MASFLDYLEKKHGLIPAGSHVFEIVPQSARLFDSNGVSGVACKVKITDGLESGREGEISLTLGGKHDGLIRNSIELIRPWAAAVGAELSPERIKGDFTRLIAALRVAGVGKRTVGTFRHDERKGQKYLTLVSVCLDDANNGGDDSGPF
jgi:hypothetical protein